MKNIKKTLVVCLLTSVACLAQATSDPRIGAILGELASVRSFKQVEISPDGKRVAWVEELIENRKDTGNSTIYIMDLRGGSAPVRISSARPSSERNLMWSPDSSRIAFLSDRDKKGQMQLYAAP